MKIEIVSQFAKPISAFTILLIFSSLLSGCTQSTHLPVWYNKVCDDPSKHFKSDDAVRLCNAIRRNDKVTVESLCESKELLNTKGDNGITPLMWAVRSDRADIFRLLLKKGADPTIVATDNFSIFKTGSYSTNPAYEVLLMPTDEHVVALFEETQTTELRFKFGDSSESVASLLTSTMNPGTSTKKRVEAFIAAKPSKIALNESIYYAMDNSRFDLAYLLLIAGAGPDAFYDIRGCAIDRMSFATLTPERLREKEREDLALLTDELKQRGFNLEQSKKRVERWVNEIQDVVDIHKAGEIRKKEIREIAKKEGKLFTSATDYPNPAP